MSCDRTTLSRLPFMPGRDMHRVSCRLPDGCHEKLCRDPETAYFTSSKVYSIAQASAGIELAALCRRHQHVLKICVHTVAHLEHPVRRSHHNTYCRSCYVSKSTWHRLLLVQRMADFRVSGTHWKRNCGGSVLLIQRPIFVDHRILKSKR